MSVFVQRYFVGSLCLILIVAIEIDTGGFNFVFFIFIITYQEYS